MIGAAMFRCSLEEHQAGPSYDIDEPEQLTDAVFILIDDDSFYQRLSANARALYNRSFDAEKLIA